MIEIEYADNGRRWFTRACRGHGDRWSIIYATACSSPHGAPPTPTTPASQFMRGRRGRWRHRRARPPGAGAPPATASPGQGRAGRSAAPATYHEPSSISASSCPAPQPAYPENTRMPDDRRAASIGSASRSTRPTSPVSRLKPLARPLAQREPDSQRRLRRDRPSAEEHRRRGDASDPRSASTVLSGSCEGRLMTTPSAPSSSWSSSRITATGEVRVDQTRRGDEQLTVVAHDRPPGMSGARRRAASLTAAATALCTSSWKTLGIT